MGIAFTTIKDSNGFLALEADWRALHGHSPANHCYQAFDWCWPAWEQVAAPLGRRLCILTGKVDGRMVLIWPCMVAGPYLRTLSCDLFQFSDVLVEIGPDTDMWLRAALRALRRQGGHALILTNLRGDSYLARHLRQHRPRGLKASTQSTRLLHLDRYRNWDDYLERLPRRLLADQKRQWRRLASLSEPWRFEVITEWQSQLELIRWVTERKVDLLRTRNRSMGIFGTREASAFYEAACHDFARRGMLFVSRLTVGKALVGALIGFVRHNCFSFSQFSYDPVWKAYSPGRLVLERSLEWCYAHGVKEVDFQPGGQDYKSDWTDDELVVEDYAIPFTVQGHALLQWHIRQLNRLLDTWWWRLMFGWMPSPLRVRIGRRFITQAQLIAGMQPI